MITTLCHVVWHALREQNCGAVASTRHGGLDCGTASVSQGLCAVTCCCNDCRSESTASVGCCLDQATRSQQLLCQVWYIVTAMITGIVSLWGPLVAAHLYMHHFTCCRFAPSSTAAWSMPVVLHHAQSALCDACMPSHQAMAMLRG